ncbi:hypothetical protein LTR36_006443 [Oleoguttula mirabilis]|uniref:Uncharacterized protein n=1 Tax=Oleoguttula mirabilis TaxID=1507867 RepID=A0AAV9JUV2_9PEZI|nr:hypothetical protein LTR36_006443 [Oleoguttula mirabilis]
MRQVRDTQELTRHVANAEKAYEVAKAVAISNGVQLPGSDVHSGFIDDVDDRYRVSLEQEMRATVDDARVLKWLQQVLDLGEDELQGAEEQGVAPADGVELDDWDAKTVEISDSSSMVAEGFARKKIDSWRATCALTEREV